MRSLLIFLKLPVPGKVKTRLAASLGAEQAAEAYKFLVAQVLDKVTPGPFESIRILFDPPSEEPAIRTWLAPHLSIITPEITYHPQSPGDLGARLESAFGDAFAAGATHVVAIGTDCIDITSQHFAQTWAALESGTDIVFGPAQDGGYYLVAQKSPHPEIFHNIPWSQPDTLERSLAAASTAHLRTSLLEPLTDIDTIEEWNATRNLGAPAL